MEVPKVKLPSIQIEEPSTFENGSTGSYSPESKRVSGSQSLETSSVFEQEWKSSSSERYGAVMLIQSAS